MLLWGLSDDGVHETGESNEGESPKDQGKGLTRGRRWWRLLWHLLAVVNAEAVDKVPVDLLT